MKKAFFIFFLSALCLAMAGIFLWNQRASLAASLISRHLNVPVTMQTLDLTKTQASISFLTIGNPPRFSSPSAFTARSILIDSTWKQLRANPLLIDSIVMDDLSITVENRKKGHTNWNQILSDQSAAPSKRHYLIKTLILRNLTVQVVTDGQAKTYPALARMEFHDISDKTGFPVNEIEKAIFEQVMQDIYKKYGLDQIFQQLPYGNIPKGIFENFFK
jgi:uncharacterized protein involved in outer membrane biogenesis